MWLYLVSSVLAPALLAFGAGELRRRRPGSAAEVAASVSSELGGSGTWLRPPTTVAAWGISLITLSLLLLGCLSLRDAWGNRLLVPRLQRCSPTPRLEAWGGAGANHTIASPSLAARLLFSQGLLLAWDFNQAEAQHSFRACLHHDAAAAMCHWGLAYAVGPFLNKVPGDDAGKEGFPTFGPAEFAAAHESASTAHQLAQQALHHAGNSSLTWREARYCAAAAARFAGGSHLPPEREDAERAYTASMEALGQAEQDATALALAAEAWLNLVPWQFVEESSGTLRPQAATAHRLLLQALRWHPQHPLALHLLVHLAELAHEEPSHQGTAQPRSLGEAAVAAHAGERAADALRGLQPRMGHLVHMPSHLYIRVGRYHDAVQANIEAYQADLHNSKLCLQAYIPEHNLQMLLYAASMAGEYTVVEEYARRMWSLPDTMPHSAWPGREWTTLLLAQVRYAMWGNVLSWPAPQRFERGPCDPGGYAYAQVAWHFARGMAFASKAQQAQQAGFQRKAQGYRQKVAQHAALLQRVSSSAPRDLHTRPGQGVGIYSPGYNDLSGIANHTLSARLAQVDGRWQQTAELLRQAVQLELGMGYVEPPRQQQPVRQCLGWVLPQAGRLQEAADVYAADLGTHPENGWSLLGLAQALMLAGHSSEAAGVQQRFAEAWQHADRQLARSCPAFA